MTNCVFSGNTVSDGSTALGGGLCVVDDGTAAVTNSTFSGNTAQSGKDAWGGGIYVENSTANVTNAIVWGNVADIEPGIYAGYFSTLNLTSSCVQGWTSGGLGGYWNTANDPLLADPDGADDILGTADDDLRLTANSSAIDGGFNGFIPEDLFDLDRNGDTEEGLPLDLGRGRRLVDDPSIQNGRYGAPVHLYLPTVDMGAYEYLNPDDGLGDPEPPAAGAPAPEPSGTAYIAFTYDALGRRIERTVDSGGASVEVTRYYYDAQNVVLETDADDAPRRSFVHGSQYIDERVLMRLPTGKEYYYLPRELYSVAALTDEDGTIVEAATYDTYGQVAVYDGSAQAVEESPVGNPYYFTGRRLDLLPTASSPQPAAKQLYHYRARAYDPGNGRFMQRDPLGTNLMVWDPLALTNLESHWKSGAWMRRFRQQDTKVRQAHAGGGYQDGMTLYEYTMSIPTGFQDPTGLMCVAGNTSVVSYQRRCGAFWCKRKNCVTCYVCQCGDRWIQHPKRELCGACTSGTAPAAPTCPTYKQPGNDCCTFWRSPTYENCRGCCWEMAEGLYAQAKLKYLEACYQDNKCEKFD